MSERYSVADKSLEDLLSDVDSDLIAGRRTERAAQAMAKWARIATFSSVASVGVAIAAVIVAALD